MIKIRFVPLLLSVILTCVVMTIGLWGVGKANAWMSTLTADEKQMFSFGGVAVAGVLVAMGWAVWWYRRKRGQ